MDERRKRLAEIEIEYASAQATKNEALMAALSTEYNSINAAITAEEVTPTPEEVIDETETETAEVVTPVEVVDETETPDKVGSDTPSIVEVWTGEELVVLEVDLPESTKSISLWVPFNFNNVLVQTGSIIVVPKSQAHKYNGLSYVKKSTKSARIVVE